MALTKVTTGGITDATIATADIADDAITAAKLASGAADLLADTTPQLGGTLDTNGQLISFGDSSSSTVNRLNFGAGNDLNIYHDGSNSNLRDSGTGALILWGSEVRAISGGGSEYLYRAFENGAVELYNNNGKKFETTSTGATVTSATNECIFRIRSENQDGAPVLQFVSDNGDDNDDLWRLRADGGATAFAIQNYASGSWESNIVCRENGNVELRYDNSNKFETDSAGTTTSGRAYITGTILQGTTDSGEANGDEATFANTGGNAGITIRSAVDAECKIYFSEGTSGGSQYRGTINYNHNTNHMAFSANEYERFRIDSSGNKILDNTFNVSSTSDRRSYFTVTGQQYHARNQHEGMIIFQQLDQTQIGSITRGTNNVAYNTTSDYRLKENVTGISDGITRLKTLKPSRFNFKSEPSITMDGFLAHEVSSIVPEAIEGEKDALITQAMLDAGTLQGTVGDPVYQQIDQSKLVPLLTAALQEAIAKIEVLETKVAALEAA